jgi:MOSC domain-containing protein YiiM
MPVTWEFRGSALVVNTAGRYRPEDLARAAAEARADPRFRPGAFLLFDGRLSEAELTTESVKWRVAWVASLRDAGFSSRCAVVVSEQPHRYGLGRMASFLLEAEGVELQVFTDVQSAIAWLDRSTATLVMGKVVSINLSDGGVPKQPVAECRVSEKGLEGDRQRDLHFHGGPNRAVCLYSLEKIEALRSDGHPIAPGTIGENLTVAGLDWSLMVPDVQVEAGEVHLQLTKFAAPCANIAGSFKAGDYSRVAQKLHPGWSRIYARVTRPGIIRVGDPIRLQDQTRRA